MPRILWASYAVLVFQIYETSSTKNLKWTVHWIVIETNLELLSGSITPNNRSYTIVLILKLAMFRLRRALLKGLQKGMLPSRVFDQKTTSKTLSQINHNLNHPHIIKAKIFPKQPIADARGKNTNSCQSCQTYFQYIRVSKTLPSI